MTTWRTATPGPANRFSSPVLWTDHPAAMSWAVDEYPSALLRRVAGDIVHERGSLARFPGRFRLGDHAAVRAAV